MAKRKGKDATFKHPNSLAESTWNLFNTKSYCDVKFLVGSSKTAIQAHKLLLMARSSVFATMFADRWTFQGNAVYRRRPRNAKKPTIPCNTINGNGDSMTVVTISDADPDIFRLLLRYIYTDDFAPDISKACSLCELAHKYDIAPLVKKCDFFISNNFTEEKSLEVFQWAQSYSLKQLMDTSAGVMARTFEKLLNDNTILATMDRETLVYLLKRDDLEVAEINIFEITLNWAGIQASSLNQNVQSILREIIPFIRFPLMHVQDFSQTVVPTGLLPKDDVITLFTYFNADAELRESIQKNIPYSSNARAFEEQETFVKISLYTPYKLKNPIIPIGCLPGETPVSVAGFIETLSFNCSLTGTTMIQSTAVLSGLTLAIRDSRSTSGFHVSTPSEYFVNISIQSINDPNLQVAARSQRVKLQLGSETIVQLQQNFELKQGYNYTVNVAFEGRVMLKKHRWQTSIPNFDDMNDTAIPNVITHPSENGTIQLSNLRVSTNQPEKYQSYHVVRELIVKKRCRMILSKNLTSLSKSEVVEVGNIK